MDVYLSLFLGLSVMGLFLAGRPALRLQVYRITLAILFIFAAFRFHVGCDWVGYLNQYWIQRPLGPAEALSRQEPLWWLIMDAIDQAGLTYVWLNVVAGVLFFAGLHAIARREPDPLGFLILAFPILILNMPMSAVRQASAIGLICFAFIALTDKRLLRFVVFTTIASLIHSSAMIFFLLLPLVRGNLTSQRLGFAAVLAIPGLYALLTSDAAGVATTRYIENENIAYGAVYRNGLLILTGLAYFILWRRRWKTLYPETLKLVDIGAAGMLFLILLLPLSTVIADRFGYYLIPIQLMILGRLFHLSAKNTQVAMAVVPYVAFAIFFAAWSLRSWHFERCYLPYQTWVFGVPADGAYLYW